MSTIAQNLEALQQAKEDIAAAITTKGGTVNSGDGFADFATDIGTIPTGSQSVQESDVNFYDYDGALVAAYTAADFANLSALPANPSHTGLTAQGWNWALAAAKTYVASYGKLNIGQMYTTASGKTEYDIEVNEASEMTATLGLNGVQKDWGDGSIDTVTSHTYATAGSYTIKLSGTMLPSISNSKKVRAVRIAKRITSIGEFAFSHCLSLQSVTIPSSITSIGESAFAHCSSLQSVTIPSSATSIGRNALTHCYSLQSVTIPSSVTSIEYGAFYNCGLLQSVTIPSSVTLIPACAFQYCYNLRSITIPVTTIASQAVCSCSSLQTITIPSSVTRIDDNAFSGCSWLTILTVLATTPPTLSSTNAIPPFVTKIYIPNGTLATYKGASNWSKFSAKFVELPA